MKALKSLLAATDFSDDAGNAIERAARIAADHQAALALLHVISGPSLASLRELFDNPAEAEARIVAESGRQLGQIAARLAGPNPAAITPRVKIGAVLPEILAAAKDADLLVLGVRGQNPVRDVILGTTAERLLGKCARPTLVVKRPPRDSYRRVVVPVDFSPCSGLALEAAMRMAPAAEIRVCHAFDVPFEGKLWLADVADDRIDRYRTQVRQRALAEIHDVIERVAGSHPRRPAGAVELGDAVRVILKKASEFDADLIVIGKHGRSAVEEFVLGSVTRHVLSDSTCDVLVVNEQRPG